MAKVTSNPNQQQDQTYPAVGDLYQRLTDGDPLLPVVGAGPGCDGQKAAWVAMSVAATLPANPAVGVFDDPTYAGQQARLPW